jgi:hypothetical protein
MQSITTLTNGLAFWSKSWFNFFSPKNSDMRHLMAPSQTKTAAIFCYQVAAWIPDMFCNFYLVKNCKIASNSTTTEARENGTDLETLEFF